MRMSKSLECISCACILSQKVSIDHIVWCNKKLHGTTGLHKRRLHTGTKSSILHRLTRGNHQGVVAQTAAIEYVQLTDILERVPEDETPLVVLFDGVTDVRNFGAIARSAECAGAHGLITPLKNSAPVNAEAIRSSAGALTTIPVCRVGSVRNTLKALQAEGFQVVAATEKSRKLLYDADFRRPTVIVMGAEDTGISKEVLKLCDEQLAIPLIGHIESLNVSAAAAVMLFEVVRQRIGPEN